MWNNRLFRIEVKTLGGFLLVGGVDIDLVDIEFGLVLLTGESECLPLLLLEFESWIY